ncbi:hypothetical protein BH20ACT2_BH20ACT2_14370 [soil metagenome]
MQGVGGGRQRGTGGDHVVDQQHPAEWWSPVGPGMQRERRPGAPLRPVAPGLRRSRQAGEQPPARQPQPSCHRPGEELGLVEAPLAPAGRRSGRPGDDVDLAHRHQLGHGPRQPPERRPGVAVLEAGHQLAAHAFVGEQRPDAGGAGRRRRAPERRPTGAARRRAGDPTDRAGGGKEHRPIVPAGCDTLTLVASVRKISAQSREDPHRTGQGQALRSGSSSTMVVTMWSAAARRSGGVRAA